MRRNNLDLCLCAIERKPTKGFNRREFLVYVPVREVEWVRGSLEWQLQNINKEKRSDAKDIAHIVRLDLLSLYILLGNFKGVDSLRRKLCDRRGHCKLVRRSHSPTSKLPHDTSVFISVPCYLGPTTEQMTQREQYVLKNYRSTGNSRESNFTSQAKRWYCK